MLATAARISYGALMGAALFGFLIRLALVSAAVLLVRDAGWVEPVALGLTLVVAHLGLLFWELRFVSISLAHPDLKPTLPYETRPRWSSESISRPLAARKPVVQGKSTSVRVVLGAPRILKKKKKTKPTNT